MGCCLAKDEFKDIKSRFCELCNDIETCCNNIQNEQSDEHTRTWNFNKMNNTLKTLDQCYTQIEKLFQELKESGKMTAQEEKLNFLIESAKLVDAKHKTVDEAFQIYSYLTKNQVNIKQLNII